MIRLHRGYVGPQHFVADTPISKTEMNAMCHNGNTLYAGDTVQDDDGFVKKCRVLNTVSPGLELQFSSSVPDLN